MTVGYLAPILANLASILSPIAEHINRSALPRAITLPGAGSVELWSLDNARVGRSRRYDFIAIDEAALPSTSRMRTRGNCPSSLTVSS